MSEFVLKCSFPKVTRIQGWSNASLRHSSQVDLTQDLHVFWKLISTSQQKKLGKSPSTNHWPGSNCSSFFCSLEELRIPLSLPLGVWHTTDQAANIKPVRLLLQWMNWALRDDCKAMLSVNVDPTERLSLLISIALISLDIPEGFWVSV